MSGALHRQGFQTRLLFRALPHEATGGALWGVTDRAAAVGQGITGPRTPTAAGTITAYAVEVDLTSLGRTEAGARVPVAGWYLFARLDQLAADPTAAGLAQDRLIQSVAQPALEFRVATVDTTLGYALCTLEVLR